MSTSEFRGAGVAVKPEESEGVTVTQDGRNDGADPCLDILGMTPLKSHKLMSIL